MERELYTVLYVLNEVHKKSFIKVLLQNAEEVEIVETYICYENDELN